MRCNVCQGSLRCNRMSKPSDLTLLNDLQQRGIPSQSALQLPGVSSRWRYTTKRCVIHLQQSQVAIVFKCQEALIQIFEKGPRFAVIQTY